jgi:glutathione S-transferase
MAPKIKLTYFDMEGAAECIRLALVLTGTEFEDERIQGSQWKDMKPKTPYGGLPIMTVDDGPMRTESKAMLRWVGATFSNEELSLYPSEKLYEVEEAVGLVEDLSRSWYTPLLLGMRPHLFGYPEDHSKTEEGKEMTASMRKKWIAEEFPKFLGYLEAKIASAGGKWLVKGENPTIADCLLVPLLRQYTRGHIDHVDTKCLENNPNMVAYVKRFCALPKVQGRYTSGIF